MNIKAAIITLLILISSNFIHAQVIRQVPEISSKSSEKPIELKKLHVSVFVIDNIATTTMDMEFYNQNSRVMEG